MPLYRRMPKRGFTNARFKKDIVTVNLSGLNKFEAGTVVTPDVLMGAGIIKKIGDGVKVLGNGDLDRALIVKAHAFSKTAVEKIEASGGRTEVI
jgi:large subunit ribosomal protein L15